MIQALATKLTAPVLDRKPVVIFCKALSVYVVIKVLFTWTIVSEITSIHKFSQPKAIWSWIMFGPGVLAVENITMFLISLLVVAIVSIILKPNYFTAAILAWLTFNFYRLTFPIANGSDQILLTLLFLAVPLSSWPILKSETGLLLQDSLYNTTLLLCKLYVSSIYLISGLDKLGSEAWRSGDAFVFIGQLDYIVNPNLAHLIPQSEGGRLVLSWFTILLELSFPVLIWYSATRIWAFIAGTLFHITIGLFLSLADFTAIMIISYLVFFDGSDYLRLSKLLRRTS